ncbi:MAG: hypothetical protein LUD68_10065 [Rikenellaceae bacterium]|nr:hypothetical protein [Rikenellaceae bacterium]
MKKYIAMLFLLAGATACSEEKITPEGTDFLTAFPQGNADYDLEFVSFYERYGTQILYRFTETDLRWNVTANIPYLAEEADPLYIEEAYRFLQEELFSYYSDADLTTILPFRILLCSDLILVTQEYGYREDGSYGLITVYQSGQAATVGFNHIAFGYANAQLSQLDEVQKEEIRALLHQAVLQWAFAKEKLEIPEQFAALSPTTSDSYWDGISEWGGYNQFGLLEYIYPPTPAEDFGLYVKYMLLLGEKGFAERFLDPSFDMEGRVAQKKPLVRKYIQERFGMDLYHF